MKIDKFKAKEDFHCSDDYNDVLSVTYDNRGEPWSEGISLELNYNETHSFLYLEKREALRLAKLITDLYG